MGAYSKPMSYIEKWKGGLLRPISTDEPLVHATTGSDTGAVHTQVCSNMMGNLMDIIHTSGGAQKPNLSVMAKLKSALLALSASSEGEGGGGVEARVQAYTHSLVDVRTAAPRLVLRPENQIVCIQHHVRPAPSLYAHPQEMLAAVPALFDAALALAAHVLRLPRSTELGITWLSGASSSWVAHPMLRNLFHVVPVGSKAGGDAGRYAEMVKQCETQNCFIVWDVLEKGVRGWRMGESYEAGSPEFLLSEIRKTMDFAAEGKVAWAALVKNIKNKWLPSLPAFGSNASPPPISPPQHQIWDSIVVHEAAITSAAGGNIFAAEMCAGSRGKLVWVASPSFAAAAWVCKPGHAEWAPAPPAGQDGVRKWVCAVLTGQGALEAAQRVQRFTSRTSGAKHTIMWEDSGFGRVHMLLPSGSGATVYTMQLPIGGQPFLSPWYGKMPTKHLKMWQALWNRMYGLPEEV